MWITWWRKLKFFFYDMGTLDALQYGIGAGGVSALARSSRTFNPNFGLVGSKSSSSISKINTSIRVDKHGIERWSKYYANGRFAPGNNTRVFRDHYNRGFYQHYGLNGLGQSTMHTPINVSKMSKTAQWGYGLSGGAIGGLTAWDRYQRHKDNASK